MKFNLRSFFNILTNERPLAWAQLSHQKPRLIVAVVGICFANILMYTQLGLRALLFEGITLIHENLKGDLFLVSAYSPTLGSLPFNLVYLYQASAASGVVTASPLYISDANWINPEKFSRPNYPVNNENQGEKDNIFPEAVKVLAFNPTQPVFNLPEVNQQLTKLSQPDSVLFDRLSQPSLGSISDLLFHTGEVSTIMENRRTYVVGQFQLGNTLFTKGHVIMSDWNYSLRNGEGSLNEVSVGLLRLKPNANPLQVQVQLKALLPESVQVLTREELIYKEQTFREADPSGIVLNFGAFIGFIVGMIVVYQILYSDVAEHLPEYATLKAMGYTDRSLLIIVLQEAVILAILGFLPGSVASLGVYSLLSSLTMIPLVLRPDVAAQVCLLTLIMCSIAGVIATRKLRNADPADVF